jgi:hypothetical protein
VASDIFDNGHTSSGDPFVFFVSSIDAKISINFVGLVQDFDPEEAVPQGTACSVIASSY